MYAVFARIRSFVCVSIFENAQGIIYLILHDMSPETIQSDILLGGIMANVLNVEYKIFIFTIYLIREGFSTILNIVQFFNLCNVYS